MELAIPHTQESLCSITFGQRARNVELGVSGSKSKGARGASQQEIQKTKEKLAEAEDETRRHQSAAAEAEAKLEEAAASHEQVSASSALASRVASRAERRGRCLPGAARRIIRWASASAPRCT